MTQLFSVNRDQLTREIIEAYNIRKMWEGCISAFTSFTKKWVCIFRMLCKIMVHSAYTCGWCLARVGKNTHVCDVFMRGHMILSVPFRFQLRVSAVVCLLPSRVCVKCALCQVVLQPLPTRLVVCSKLVCLQRGKLLWKYAVEAILSFIFKVSNHLHFSGMHLHIWVGG